MPVEVLGLDAVPLAGDELRVAPDEKTARTVAEARARRRRAAGMAHPMTLAGGARLEDIFAMVQRGEVATLNLVLKADVQGSLEALTDALRKLDQDHEEVRLSFVHRAVGGINESDINLAAVSNATVIGFNVRPDRQARELAATENVELRLYEVIYQVLEDVTAALVGMLQPEFEEFVTGDAEVREIFSVPRVGQGRRLLRHERDHHPRVEGPVPARGCRHLERHHRHPQALQGRRRARFSPGSSAASASRTSRTSSRVTSSRPTTSKRSPAPSPERASRTTDRVLVDSRTEVTMPGPPPLDQFNLVTADLDATLTFYRRLGVTVPEHTAAWPPGTEARHVEATMPGGLRLEFDNVAMARLWHAGSGTTRATVPAPCSASRCRPASSSTPATPPVRRPPTRSGAPGTRSSKTPTVETSG